MFTTRYGNMFDAWQVDKEEGVLTDLFFITASSTLKTVNNALVMDRGAAAEAAQRFADHNLPVILGKEIAKRHQPVRTVKNFTVYADYHILVSTNWQKGARLGLLQTKRYHADKSPLDLVVASLAKLREFILHAGVMLGRDPVVHMNYPGVGYGGLRLGEVRPHLLDLPGSVSVWQPKGAQPIQLPDNHKLKPIVEMDEEEFTERFLNAPGFQNLYTGVDDQPNGRLVQYLTLTAYIDTNDKTAARHIGLNTMAHLRRMVAGGD